MKLKLLSSIIFVLCISLFLFLGFWQLDRAKEKENIINLYENRQLLPQVKLDFSLQNNIEETFFRNYILKGKYMNKTFLIDNKIKDKKPGFNVISPFRILNTNEIILVDRGWIPLIGTRQDIEKNYQYLNDQKIQENVQEINGYIYPKEESYTIGEIYTNDNWPRVIQAINFNQMKKTLLNNDSFVPGVTFRLSKENLFGFSRDWQIIFMKSSKHIGYAFQWFSMAIALFILGIIFYIRKKDE